MPTTRNDPLAMLVVYALLALMAYAGFKQLDRPADARAQDIIIAATATPALPTAVAPALGQIGPTAIPAPEDMPAAAPAPEAPMPVSLDAAPENDPQNGAGDAAPVEARDLPILQATIEAPAIDTTLNNPDLNGGNVAPDGCPFPIVNGICANGVLAKTIDEGLFGQKSIADTGGDPAHAIGSRP